MIGPHTGVAHTRRVPRHSHTHSHITTNIAHTPNVTVYISSSYLPSLVTSKILLWFITKYSKTSLIRTSLIRTLANLDDLHHPASHLQNMLGILRQVKSGNHCCDSKISASDVRNGKLSGKNKSKKATHRHKTLTIDEKIAILDELATSYAAIAEWYRVGRSTIGDIKKEVDLQQFKRKLTEKTRVSLIQTTSLIQTARH